MRSAIERFSGSWLGFKNDREPYLLSRTRWLSCAGCRCTPVLSDTVLSITRFFRHDWTSQAYQTIPLKWDFEYITGTDPFEFHNTHFVRSAVSRLLHYEKKGVHHSYQYITGSLIIDCINKFKIQSIQTHCFIRLHIMEHGAPGSL